MRYFFGRLTTPDSSLAMPLSLVNDPETSHAAVNTNRTDTERLALIRRDVTTMLEERTVALRAESKRVHALMEQVMFRIDHHGNDTRLDDFSVLTWERTASEVRILQEVLQTFEAHE